MGIAAHRSFVTYVATVVEVKVDDDGTLTIVDVWSAMDAGTVVNPGHAQAQMEGGTIYGLSNALYGQLTAKNGVIEQANFPNWRVMRMNESPLTVHTHIVDSDAPPGRRGRTPHTTGRTRADQRDFRSLRQTHPRSAHIRISIWQHIGSVAN